MHRGQLHRLLLSAAALQLELVARADPLSLACTANKNDSCVLYQTPCAAASACSDSYKSYASAEPGEDSCDDVCCQVCNVIKECNQFCARYSSEDARRATPCHVKVLKYTHAAACTLVQRCHRMTMMPQHAHVSAECTAHARIQGAAFSACTAPAPQQHPADPPVHTPTTCPRMPWPTSRQMPYLEADWLGFPAGDSTDPSSRDSKPPARQPERPARVPPPFARTPQAPPRVPQGNGARVRGAPQGEQAQIRGGDRRTSGEQAREADAREAGATQDLEDVQGALHAVTH